MNVAILLATYNSELYIRELLDSLINQTCQDFTCYIHDDGSKDSTIEIIKEYAKEYCNKFVILDYPPTGSSKANFLSMLKLIDEPYVMFCDHDDVWERNKIEVSLAEIQKNEDSCKDKPILVFTDLRVVDDNLKEISPSFMRYTGLNPNNTALCNLLVENVVAGCTVIMNKPLYMVVKKIDNYENIMMHDLWCALVASLIGEVVYIEKPLILYRQHGDNVKGADAAPSNLKRLKLILEKLFKGTLVTTNKKWHELFRLQAMELAKLPDISDNDRKTLSEFSMLGNKNKFRRVKFYLDHHIKREKNNIWLYMWC